MWQFIFPLVTSPLRSFLGPAKWCYLLIKKNKSLSYFVLFCLESFITIGWREEVWHLAAPLELLICFWYIVLFLFLFFVSSFCFVLFLFFLQCYFRTRQLRSFRWLSSYSDGHLFCPKKVSFFGAHVDLSEFSPVFVMGLDGVGLRFCSEGVCLQDIFPR